MPIQESPIQPLSAINGNPSVLIPNRLKELVTNPNNITVIPLDVTLGRMDEEYNPSISLLIAERDGLALPTKTQEEDLGLSDIYNWSRVLNHHRLNAINNGDLSEQDRALILIIAQQLYPYGVIIESYIEATSLRKQGLGRAFYANYDDVLRKMGFRYYLGMGNLNNINFFLKTGFHSFDQTDSAAIDKNLILIPPYFRTIHESCIKFLDPGLEKECVRPKNL